MDLYQTEQKVIKKMKANPTIPDEAFNQLVNEEFGSTNQYYPCNQEVAELKRYHFNFMRSHTTEIDPQDELDFCNRNEE